MVLFERTKKLAEKRGLSLNDLAEKLELPENSLYRWKKSIPNATIVGKTAKILNTSSDYLLGNTEIIEPMKKNEDINLDDKLNDETVILSFRGKPISPRDRKIILSVMSGISEEDVDLSEFDDEKGEESD